MFEKLDQIEKKYEELSLELSNGELDFSSNKYLELTKEHSSIEQTVDLYKEYKKIKIRLDETKDFLQTTQDEELKELAKEEFLELTKKSEEFTTELKFLLYPQNPNSNKNIIMEIRAGTGGEEASLFAADLHRMYLKYAEKNKWKVELLNSNPTEVGGLKEVILSLAGKGVYDKLKFEMGVHRVQRIPETESGGRIHTSAVTVAVLTEAEEADITILPNDLKVDVFRSSGPGGQSVNTTDSAVRLTHIPSGIIVQCQDEKSQHKNKAKALRVLRARLQEKINLEQQKERADERKLQIGSGDRSERIRTYNFPQNRISDHRVNLTIYKLENILNGDLDEIISVLIQSEKEELLKS